MTDEERPLKIALVAPPWFEVPPDGYGGIEQLVADLANALVGLGHDVTLIAAGPDHTRARMVPTFPEPQEGLGTPRGVRIELEHAARADDVLDELDIDVVHDHTLAGPLLAKHRDAPTVVTAHGPIDDATAAYYGAATDLSVVAISENQRGRRPDLPWVATVHNAINVEDYPFQERKEDFFLFLGRMNADKGADQAIEIARAADTPLVIAAKCDEPVEKAYYEGTIEPLLGSDVRYVGTADADEKRDLLRAAKGLLFPIRWDEPFGLVMTEAMACGTPVIAARRGSVPEIVRDGETGFICDDLEGFVDAARRVDDIEPARCREEVRERFDVPVMVRAYDRTYRAVLATADGTSLTETPGSEGRAEVNTP